MDSKVRRTLALPIKKLSSCVTGVKEQEARAVHRTKRGTRGVKSPPPPRTGRPKGPPVLRSYQADLEKERKLREALKAQKNAERSAMRTHFRKKYQLSVSSKDTVHLSTVGGSVALPRELTKMIHPETPAKDEGHILLNAFQGLSFNVGLLKGPQSKSPIPGSADGELCKIM